MQGDSLPRKLSNPEMHNSTTLLPSNFVASTIGAYTQLSDVLQIALSSGHVSILSHIKLFSMKRPFAELHRNTSSQFCNEFTKI